MTLGTVRVMGAGVVLTVCAKQVYNYTVLFDSVHAYVM